MAERVLRDHLLDDIDHNISFGCVRQLHRRGGRHAHAGPFAKSLDVPAVERLIPSGILRVEEDGEALIDQGRRVVAAYGEDRAGLAIVQDARGDSPTLGVQQIEARLEAGKHIQVE